VPSAGPVFGHPRQSRQSRNRTLPTVHAMPTIRESDKVGQYGTLSHGSITVWSRFGNNEPQKLRFSGNPCEDSLASEKQENRFARVRHLDSASFTQALTSDLSRAHLKRWSRGCREVAESQDSSLSDDYATCWLVVAFSGSYVNSVSCGQACTGNINPLTLRVDIK
jgi:hypothetical protein